MSETRAQLRKPRTRHWRGCEACLRDESGECDWCHRRRLCALMIDNAENVSEPPLTAGEFTFDRWFWLEAAAHVLIRRTRTEPE